MHTLVWNDLFQTLFPLSVQEREENMKTVEGLLEKGLIEVANKEEELKVPLLFDQHQPPSHDSAFPLLPRNHNV